MFGISRRSIQLVKENSTLYHRRIVVALNIMANGAEDKPFLVEYAAQGRAKCKTCKQQIEKSVTRIGKLVSNPFGEDGGMMKQWYHVPCIFDTLSRARATTKKIDSTDDLGGFENLKDDDQAKILSLIKGLQCLLRGFQSRFNVDPNALVTVIVTISWVHFHATLIKLNPGK